MKVIFVTRVFPPGGRHGGAFTEQRILGEELAKRGHSVHVLTSDIYAPGEHYEGSRLDEVYRGIHIHRLRSRLRYHWDAVPVSAGRALRKALTSDSVIHVFGIHHYLEQVAVRMALKMSVPVFVMPQGEIPAKGHFVGPKKVFDVLRERPKLSRVSGVIATSASEERDLLDWGVAPTRVHQLPGFAEPLPPPSVGANHVRHELGIPAEAITLVWSGRFDPIKGLDLLLKTLAADEELAGVHLLLMGADVVAGHQEETVKLARTLGLENRVRFLGWCDEETKSTYYSASDAFILPSEYESFSRSAGEASMLGLPTMLADTTGIASRPPGGSMVFSRTVEALSAVLKAFAADPTLRADLRRAALTAAQDLHPSHAAEKLEDIYRAGLGSYRP